MSKVRKVVLHTLTGYISTGTEDNTPPPLLNPIKTEAKPEVTEPLKQGERQTSNKMLCAPNLGCYRGLALRILLRLGTRLCVLSSGPKTS